MFNDESTIVDSLGTVAFDAFIEMLRQSLFPGVLLVATAVTIGVAIIFATRPGSSGRSAGLMPADHD